MAEPDEGSDIGSALSSLSAALSQLSSAVVNQTSDEINARVTDPAAARLRADHRCGRATGQWLVRPPAGHRGDA